MLRNFLCLLALGSMTAAYGTTIGTDDTTCPTASLATYQALGSAGCTVNGVLFNDFALLLGYSNGATPSPTAADILLSPGTAPGASINIAYPVITRNYVSFALQYDFDPVPVIGNAEISLDVMGDVDVFESLCPGGPFRNVPNGCFGRPTDTSPLNLEVFNDHLGSTKLVDSAAINPPVTNGEVQIYFVLNGLPNAPAGFDGLTSDLNAPTVPEPATYLLLSVALASAAAVRLMSSSQKRRRT